MLRIIPSKKKIQSEDLPKNIQKIMSLWIFLLLNRISMQGAVSGLSPPIVVKGWQSRSHPVVKFEKSLIGMCYINFPLCH